MRVLNRTSIVSPRLKALPAQVPMEIREPVLATLATVATSSALLNLGEVLSSPEVGMFVE